MGTRVMLVLGLMAFPALAALPSYFSCKEILEIEQLFVRDLERGDLDDVEAFLVPVRTPVSRWRQAYLAERAKGVKPGLIVRGGDDQPIGAVLVWRPTADGVELLEFHIAASLRAIQLDLWLLRRLQKQLGPGKVIRMVLPDLDRRRALELQSLGFVYERTDPNALEMPGLLDGRVYVLRPDGEGEEPAEGESTPAAPEEPSIDVGVARTNEYPKLAELADRQLGSDVGDLVRALVRRDLPLGTSLNAVVARDGDGVASFILYISESRTRKVRVEAAVINGLGLSEERALIDKLVYEAKRRRHREITFVVGDSQIDAAPFQRYGFTPVPGGSFRYEIPR